MQLLDLEAKNNPNTCPPPADKLICLHGSGCWGDWKIKGYRKNYKCKQTFKTRKDGNTYWRFVDENDCNVQHVDAWSFE